MKLRRKLSQRDLKRLAKGQLPEPSEDEFMRQVLKLAKVYGWKTAHFRPGMNRRGQWQTAVQGDGKGFPDILLIRGDEIMVVELKVGMNVVTAEQADWIAAFAGAKVPTFVWRSGDWMLIEYSLKNGPRR